MTRTQTDIEAAKQNLLMHLKEGDTLFFLLRHRSDQRRYVQPLSFVMRDGRPCNALYLGHSAAVVLHRTYAPNHEGLVMGLHESESVLTAELSDMLFGRPDALACVTL